MPLKVEQRTRFSDELKIIPTWAWVLAGVAFAAAQIVFDFVMASDPKAPPLWGRILMAIGAGGLLGCYFLIIGYINRDAGRRGMNRLVWTAVAVLVPNALGIVLYFLMRQPVPGVCPHCGTKLQSEYSYCPACGQNLTPQCPTCRHAIHYEDIFCPYCGRELKAGGTLESRAAHQADLNPKA